MRLYRSMFVTLILAAAAAAAVWHFAHVDQVFAWLAAANAAAFLTYGYDKAVAGSKRTRVPESTLLLLALVGGSLGAFVGMEVFRHKTSKGSFRLRFWLVVLAQAALVGAYWFWLRG